ncbi:MAG TPA: protein-L-isoaspartate O-methyltransferase [Gammaproteobacteria bacterium]|nr:protein-L-isoaspartate O-methyltransferase [Gammaproteobacteria bacterium]
MNYEAARRQMISQQIRTWDVLDEHVLDTLRDTPREAFVPEAERDLAFADTEVPLPHGQCMMSPKVEARLLQALAIEPTDSALEIGTGSGYLAACLGRLAENVVSLEIFADLSEAAGQKLRRQGIHNVELRDEDATRAHLDARFDVVAITASLPVLSERYISLLNPGGRLFVVVGRSPVMEAVLVRMHADGSWTEQSLFETMLTPMMNADEPEAFVL